MSKTDQAGHGGEVDPERICTDCGNPCEVIEEVFVYNETHCTHGISGTHHTGVWVSNCCGAEIEEI